MVTFILLLALLVGALIVQTESFISPNHRLLKLSPLNLSGLPERHSTTNIEQSNDVLFTGHDKAKKIKLKGTAIATCILVTSLLAGSTISDAQIPTSEQFYQQSGTVVAKPKNQRSSGSEATQSLREAVKQMDTRSKLLQLPSVIREIESDVKQEKWDSVIADIKALKELKLKYFGFGSIANMAQQLKVSAAVAEEIEADRADFYFTLGQVNDLSVSSRLYFFNSEDLAQTQLLIDDGEKRGANPLAVDRTTEPLSLLREADKMAAKFVAALQ